MDKPPRTRTYEHYRVNPYVKQYAGHLAASRLVLKDPVEHGWELVPKTQEIGRIGFTDDVITSTEALESEITSDTSS